MINLIVRLAQMSKEKQVVILGINLCNKYAYVNDYSLKFTFTEKCTSFYLNLRNPGGKSVVSGLLKASQLETYTFAIVITDIAYQASINFLFLIIPAP